MRNYLMKPTKVKLIESHQISKNHPFYVECDHLTLLSKNLWNATNYIVRQHLFKTNKYLSYNKVNAYFTHTNQFDYRSLPAKVAKGTQRLLDKSYRSFFNKSGFRDIPGYLHKTRGRQVVHYEKGALSFKRPGFVKLSQTSLIIKTDKPVDFVRIVPRNDYFVIEIGYTKDLPVTSVTPGNVASIDLGLNNLATVTSNVFAPVIINGKPIQNINFYAKRLISEQRAYVTKTSHLINSLYRKRYNKLKDYYHKSTRFLVDKFVNNDIETVVIGYNENWKRRNKIQAFQRIAYKQFIDILTYKCQLSGINVVLQEESYTSKASFYDLDDIPNINEDVTKPFSGKRVSRGSYLTRKGYKLNADVNGSLNILRKSKVWEDIMYANCVRYSKKPITRYNF